MPIFRKEKRVSGGSLRAGLWVGIETRRILRPPSESQLKAGLKCLRHGTSLSEVPANSDPHDMLDSKAASRHCFFQNMGPGFFFLRYYCRVLN
jgi:hypothetical protein